MWPSRDQRRWSGYQFVLVSIFLVLVFAIVEIQPGPGRIRHGVATRGRFQPGIQVKQKTASITSFLGTNGRKESPLFRAHGQTRTTASSLNHRRERAPVCRNNFEDDDITDTTAEVEEDLHSEQEIEDIARLWAVQQGEIKLDDFGGEFTEEEIHELWKEAMNPSLPQSNNADEKLWYTYCEDGPAWEGKSGWTGFSGPHLIDEDDQQHPVLDYFDSMKPPSERIDAIFKEATEKRGQSEREKIEEALIPELENGRRFGLFPADVGDRVPRETTLFTFDEQHGKVIRKNASTLFTNKTWLLFGMHGAFNPICETEHLKAINEWAPYIFKNKLRIGIVTTDDIYTLQAWKLMNEVDSRVDMISDAYGELSQSLGMTYSDDDDRLRNIRYSSLVHNNTIMSLFKETPERVVETLPGPLVQSYKHWIVRKMNETGQFLQTMADYTALLENEADFKYHVDYVLNKERAEMAKKKFEAEVARGSNNVVGVKGKKKDEEPDGWAVFTPPRKSDPFSPHEDYEKSGRDARLPVDEHYGDSQWYTHDDNQTEVWV
mmetsp:Transcript_34678/g.83909  ORF Transcript_34678/g.83909 Transcript_34678/m.83909 type:complete len:547 (+) Transcript_34678:26-1666(+)